MGANDILNIQLKNKYLLDSNNFEEIIYNLFTYNFVGVQTIS